MKKLLSPYIKVLDDTLQTVYVRRTFGGAFYHVWHNKRYSGWKNEFSHYGSADNPIMYSSEQLAMEALDKELISRGWEFLTQEEYDKYQILI